MRYSRLITILFLLNTLLAANNNLEKVSLQLSWKHQFQFAGYYVAKELGYYKDAGIDVNLKEFEYGMNISHMIETEQVDFAIGRSSLLIDKSKGKDLVALGAIFQNSPLVLLTIDPNLINLEDLISKRIMITGEAKDTASISAMLNSHSINFNELLLQKHSFNVYDLITKKTDIMASYLSNEPIILDDKNIEYQIFDPKDYGFDFYSDILYTTSKYIDKNPKLTKAFFEATLKGWKYAFNNIGKTSKLIYQKYNTQNKTLTTIVSEGEVLKKLVHHEDTNNIGCLDNRKLQKIVDIYKVLGLITEEIDLDSFIYEHNPHDVMYFKLSHDDKYILPIIIFLLLVSIVSILFYLSVKKRWLITQQSLDEKLEELEHKDKQLYEQAKIVAMSEMIGNIAHQWRQPLSVISTGASGILVSKEFNTLTDEEIEDTCTLINENAQYLSTTIDNFRKFVKKEHVKKQFYLKDNIDSFLNLIKGMLKNNDIQIVLDIDNDISINSYENELIQCFMNIIDNSKDALIKNKIENKYIFISTSIDLDRIIITIKDNAGGIETEIIQKLFEPYFTTKHKAQGTGLGLHMTYNLIVNGMNGSIEVKNVMYEYNNESFTGAEFIIILNMK